MHNQWLWVNPFANTRDDVFEIECQQYTGLVSVRLFFLLWVVASNIQIYAWLPSSKDLSTHIPMKENCTFLTLIVRNSNEQSGQHLSQQPNQVLEIEIIPNLGKFARETNEDMVNETIKHLNFWYLQKRIEGGSLWDRLSLTVYFHKPLFWLTM